MNDTVKDIEEINGKLVDLKKALPLTMGDFRKLQLMGIDVTSIKTNDFNAQAQFICVVLSKSCRDLVIEDIDTLPAIKVAEIAQYINSHQQSLNRPLRDGSIT